MKKAAKKLMVLLLMLTMVIPTVPAHADEVTYWYDDFDYVTLYPAQAERDWPWANHNYICTVKGKVKNLKCSNKSIMEVGTSKMNDETAVYFHVKKTGTATVSFTVGKKNYTKKIRVKKYSNPIVSFQIGKAVFPVQKFNKTTTYYTKYSKYANKNLKVTLKLKDEWEPKAEIGYWEASESYGHQVYSGKTIPFRGGAGFIIIFDAVHKTSGRIERFFIEFN